jgi:hypothetical protein
MEGNFANYNVSHVVGEHSIGDLFATLKSFGIVPATIGIDPQELVAGKTIEGLSGGDALKRYMALWKDRRSRGVGISSVLSQNVTAIISPDSVLVAQKAGDSITYEAYRGDFHRPNDEKAKREIVQKCVASAALAVNSVEKGKLVITDVDNRIYPNVTPYIGAPYGDAIKRLLTANTNAVSLRDAIVRSPGLDRRHIDHVGNVFSTIKGSDELKMSTMYYNYTKCYKSIDEAGRASWKKLNIKMDYSYAPANFPVIKSQVDIDKYWSLYCIMKPIMSKRSVKALCSSYLWGDLPQGLTDTLSVINDVIRISEATGQPAYLLDFGAHAVNILSLNIVVHDEKGSPYLDDVTKGRFYCTSKVRFVKGGYVSPFDMRQGKLICPDPKEVLKKLDLMFKQHPNTYVYTYLHPDFIGKYQIIDATNGGLGFCWIHPLIDGDGRDPQAVVQRMCVNLVACAYYPFHRTPVLTRDIYELKRPIIYKETAMMSKFEIDLGAEDTSMPSDIDSLVAGMTMKEENTYKVELAIDLGNFDELPELEEEDRGQDEREEYVDNGFQNYDISF